MRWSRMLAIAGAAVLASLTLTIATPPGIAEASSLMACGTSPAAAVVCAEALGTTVPAVGVAAVGTGSTAATAGTAAVVVAPTAPGWAAGVSTVISAVGAGAATLVGGMLSMFGIGETEIATDPSYVLPSGPATALPCTAASVCVPLTLAPAFTYSGTTYHPVCSSSGVPGQGLWFGPPFNDSLGFTFNTWQIENPNSNSGLGKPAALACQAAGVMSGRVVGVSSSWLPDGVAELEVAMSSSSALVGRGAFVAFESSADVAILGTNRVTLRCTDGTTTTDVVSMYPYDVIPGSPILFPETKCAPGWVLDSMTVETQEAGTNTWTEIATGQNPDEVIAVPDNFPNCVSDVGQETCYLRLYDGSDWCGPGGIACPEWVAHEQITPGRYACRYGAYSVPLIDCSAYRKPGTGVQPNTDAEGERIPITAPVVPAESVQPLRDPVTGTQYPDWLSVTNPTGTPATSPQTAECFPSGWGILNPVEWVLKPVQCALQWAFVPRTQVMTQTMTQLETAVSTRAPAQIAQMVGAWAFVPPPGGCEGITVPLSSIWSGVDDWHILNACPGEPLAPLAGITSVIVGISALLGAAIACTRSIAGIVQFGGVNGD